MRLKLYLIIIYMFILQFHNLQELRHSASLVTKVFIQRDYSDGTVCRFLTKFPSELDNRVRQQNTQRTEKNPKKNTLHLHLDLCACFSANRSSELCWRRR